MGGKDMFFWDPRLFVSGLRPENLTHSLTLPLVSPSDLHQVLGSMVSLGSRESLPLSRRGSRSRLDPLETTPKVRANSEEFLVEMVVGSPAGASAPLPGVARGARFLESACLPAWMWKGVKVLQRYPVV
eukprot:s4201_g1.t1